MSELVKISIVVPVYNMEKYLSRCMKTLLEQTSDVHEIILVDDGSTDQSPELCDRYAEENPDKIRVVHKKNGGLSSARNAGMDVAKGEWVIFPDPDDWVEKEYIQCGWEIIQKEAPELVCLGHFISYDDRETEANPNPEGSYKKMKQNNAKNALLLPPYMSGFAWNKFYRLDIIKDHNLRFLDDVGTTEDLDFAFRYLNYCNKICFDPEKRVYHYYQRSDAATHGNFSIKKLEAIHTYEKIINSGEASEKLIRAAKEEICNTAINLIPLFFQTEKKSKQVYQRIRKYIQLYFKEYITSKRYGTGRKVQVVLARYIPRVYAMLKSKK